MVVGGRDNPGDSSCFVSAGIKAYIWVMKTLTIQIPDTVDFNHQEALMAIACGLYGKGRLSLGQAATLVGLTKQAFMEILGEYGVSVFNYSPEELDSDIANAKSYHL
jgi:predicted HTH domain antitoxin